MFVHYENYMDDSTIRQLNLCVINLLQKASLFDITLSSIEHFLKNTSTYPCSLKRNQEPYAQLKKIVTIYSFY